MITSILKTKAGSILISIILGVGIAALFRKVCNKESCIVIKGPKLKEVSEFYYKIKDDCYRYTPYVVDCTESKNIVHSKDKLISPPPPPPSMFTSS
jgi:hypothetical protein